MARKSFHDEYITHGGQPIPVASRVGNIIATGGVAGNGKDGKVPADIDAQCANMFANLKRIIETAGGTVDQIVKVTVLVKDRNARDAINREWVAMFPDEHARPARQTLVYNDLAGAMVVQLDAMAVVG